MKLGLMKFLFRGALLVCSIVASVLYSINIYAGDDVIWWPEAKINGQSVRFAVDTGAGYPMVIWSGTAKHLGIKVTPPDYQPATGKVAVGTSELCDVDLG